MEVLKFGEKYDCPAVLCLGFFDCMHSGHVKLLRYAQLLAGRTAKVVLFTFGNNHFQTLNRGTKLLFTFDERLQIYEGLGVDAVLKADFDEAFMAQTAEEFLHRLRCCCNLKWVVCGADFTCGSDLASADMVRSILHEFVPVDVVDIVCHGGQKISSSLVRKLLCEHKISEANSFLTQPFFFEGIVTEGRHDGHKLGFPTANLNIPQEKLAPEGVYAGSVLTNGKHYKAIVNVGYAPTFDFCKSVCEAHLLHFDGNLYGQKIKVFLQKYIRPIQKFDDVRQLCAQLRRDCEVADDQIRAEWQQ